MYLPGSPEMMASILGGSNATPVVDPNSLKGPDPKGMFIDPSLLKGPDPKGMLNAPPQSRPSIGELGSYQEYLRSHSPYEDIDAPQMTPEESRAQMPPQFAIPEGASTEDIAKLQTQHDLKQGDITPDMTKAWFDRLNKLNDYKNNHPMGQHLPPNQPLRMPGYTPYDPFDPLQNAPSAWPSPR